VSCFQSCRLPRLDSLDVFFLVVLTDLDISPTRLEVDGDDLTEPLLGGTEGVIDDIGNIVFPASPRRTISLTSNDSQSTRFDLQHPR
jgi:hypothetical protein